MNPQAMNAPPLAVAYVLLHHTGQAAVPDHFDLLVDFPATPGGRLLTWRLLTPPESWLHRPPTALRLPDHRRLYLTYEGPISGDRGHVRRVAAGMAKLLAATSTTLTLTLPDPALTLILPR